MRYLLFACALLAVPGLSAQESLGGAAKIWTLNELGGLEKKYISLAEAIPAERYSWSPGPGVRSVAQVFVHVAGANMMLPVSAGVKPPPGLDRGMEKTVTEKPKVVELLKQSFAHLTQAVKNAGEADLEKATKLFGRPTTNREVYMQIVVHMHEHLGQAIAYARMNSVTPPWSQGREN